MSIRIAQYPLVASAPLVMGACMTLSILLFSIIILLLYLKSNSELTMLHRIQSCMRVLVVSQTAFTVAAVVVLFTSVAPSGPSSTTFTRIISARQAADVLKAAGATLCAGYAFFATEHQAFRWVALIGAVMMAVVDALDITATGQLIGLFQASRRESSAGDDTTRAFAVRALRVQYAAKVFSFFAWLLTMQIIGCLMHALGWFVLSELPNDEEIAGHLKELARATIARRVQEKHSRGRFEGTGGNRLFSPTNKLEVTWDKVTDEAIGRENRESYPISTNPRGRIPPEVQKELCQLLLKMGVTRHQIYEVLEEDDNN